MILMTGVLSRVFSRSVDKYLEPGESLSEILFGLIMTLTFTLGAGVLVREGPHAARELLVATVGCNVAWGIIDGMMYLAGQRFEQGRRARLGDRIRSAASEDAAASIVAGELDPMLGPISSASDRVELYGKIAGFVRGAQFRSSRLSREDVYGALTSFWLVFFSIIPAALPFLVIDDSWIALRVSNAMLIFLLFLVGHRWARHTSLPPFRVGLSLVPCNG